MAAAVAERSAQVPPMATQARYACGQLLGIVGLVDYWRNRRNELAREVAGQQGKCSPEHRRLLREAMERERKAALDLRDAAVYVAGMAGHALEEDDG